MIPTQCVQAQKDIDEIEKGLANPESVFYKTLMNKGQLIRLLAASYEMLSVNNIIDVPVNKIANHIVHKVEALNSDLSTTNIYHALPQKYKYHQINPKSEEDEFNSQHGNENSSLNTNYEEQNSSEINYYTTQIELCKKILLHLKSEPYVEKTDSDGAPLLDLLEYDSDMVIRRAAQQFVLQTFDNRKTVPTNTIHLLLQAYMQTSNKYAAGVYISKLKQFGIQKKDNSIQIQQKLFTPKQLGKILKGETKDVHQSFIILNTDEAYENGFYGKCNCSECGSWRIRLESRYNYQTDTFEDPKLHCYECLQTTKPPLVKFPLSRPTPK